jgi:Ca2+-binding EF-hand superfamily protein
VEIPSMMPISTTPSARQTRRSALALLLALAGIGPWHPAAGQESQIRQAFDLLDANGDGRISRQEFQLNKTQIFYRSLQRTGETSSLRLEESSLAPEAFADADTDSDGVLSGSEWIEARFAQFEIYDADSDQAISLEELESSMREYVRE